MRERGATSLRLRLILGSLAGVLLAMLLAGLFIGQLYSRHTTERFESELDHHLDELIAMTLAGKDGSLQVMQPLSDPLFNIAHSGIYWQIDGQGGARLRSTSLGQDILLPAQAPGWQARELAGQTIMQRSVHRALPAGASMTVTIAAARSLLDAQIAHFHGDLLLSMSVVGALLIIGALLLVRFGLAPVQRLGEEIERLRHGEVERLGAVGPPEFAPIVTRLNALLDGQAQLIARARTEAGNLAHNLRTPLALIADEAEQLRLRGEREASDFLLARCDVMQRQIDHHLARAAIAGTRGGGTLTHVAPLVRQIVDAMRRLHPRPGLRFELEVPADLRLPMDEGDLAEILSNLIDNACKWTTSVVHVTISAAMIEVRDDGPGIPVEQRAAALSIGGRLDPVTPGSGLGLAAVHDLLGIYGAHFILDQAPEGGLCARVLLEEKRHVAS